MKTLKSLVLVGVLTVIGAAHTSAQNLIVNGDFTANAAAFTKVPGYALPAGSVAIADWVNVTGGGAGINGAATRIGNVFGPTTTGGRTYAFVAGGVNQLRQTLPITYSPDTVYKLSFDAAGRAGYTNVTFRVQIGDSTQIHVTTQVGAVAGAALDCFAQEPVTAPHRFGELDNVLLAPHCIAWTDELFRDIGRAACQVMVDLSLKRRPNGVLNPEVFAQPGFQKKWERFCN